MSDLAKFIAAAAGGAIAMNLYRNYQADQALAAHQAVQAGRSPVQRLTDTATSAFRDFVPAGQVNGMGGHMPMPQYAPMYQQPAAPAQNDPMRRVAAQVSGVPPAPPAAVAPNEGEAEFEQYGDGNMMGGQAF